MAETKTRSMRLDRCALFLSIACASVAVASTDSALAAPTATKPAAAPKPPPKPKKGDTKAAGRLFKKGKEHFEKKEYAEAKAAFVEADEIVPGAVVEYWTGRCEEELANYAEAVADYEKALTDPKFTKQADDAKDRVAKLKARPMKVKITAGDAAGASIKVDGAAIADKTPAEIELAPGTHKIALSAAGMKDGAGDVTVAALTPGAFDLKLEPVPATPPPPPDGPAPGVVAVAATPPPVAPVIPPTSTPPAESSDKTWAYVTGGVAIVGIGVGTYFGIQAMSDHSDYTAPGGATADLRDTGTHHALISDIGFGIGITLAITSLVLYFGGDDAPESKSAAPSASPPPPAHASASAPTFVPYVSPGVAGKSPSTAGALATFHF